MNRILHCVARLTFILLGIASLSLTATRAEAQGIPVVGGGSLSYVRPSSPLPCGSLTGTIYNFYGYVYFLNGTPYGISTGGTFWRSINCSTLRPDPPETTTFAVPGYQGGVCSIAFTIFNANQTSAVLTCPPVTANPVFAPAAGSYSASQTVSISDATPGATIYVTTDGSTPSQQSPRYSGPFTISTSETVRAIATSNASTISGITNAAYTINLPTAAAPSITPLGGTISTPQTVTISDPTPGSTIYLSFDGSTPTTSGTVYTTPLTVTSSETVKAIAVASNYLTSPVSSATFVTSGNGIFKPTAVPTSTFINQAVAVTFTAQLGNDPTLQAGGVSLLKYRSDGSLAGSLGMMYDDGTHGDAKAGDGIYTAQASVTDTSETALYFRVSSIHKNSTTLSLSNPVEFDVVRPFTQTEVAAIFNVPKEADQFLQSLYATGMSQPQAQAATISWLEQQPGVYQAGGDNDGGIWYLLSSGVAGGILMDSNGTRGGSASRMSSPTTGAMVNLSLPSASQTSDSAQSSDVIFNTKGIVLDPYNFQFSPDESASIAYSLRKSCVSVATGGPILGEAANVSTFKTLGQYGVVAIASHGNTWYGGLSWSSTDFPLLKPQVDDNVSGPSPSGALLSTGPQVVIFTGQHLTLANEAALLLNTSSYAADLKAFNLVIGYRHSTGDYAFVITPKFVSTYAVAAGNQLVYAGACRSYFVPDLAHPNPGQPSNVPNATMAQAFVGAGPVTAGSYFGYTEYVSSLFAAKEGTAVFNALSVNGTTTGSAFAPLASDEDGGALATEQTGPAKFFLYGDHNLALPYCVQSDELAQFVFEDGAPGNLTIYINGVAQELTGLAPLATRDLGFSDLPAGSTYTMIVYANGGFADYTINLPPGFEFDNGQASVSNHIISFAGPITYHFHSVASVAVSAASEGAASLAALAP